MSQTLNKYIIFIAAVLAAVCLQSCIDDTVSSSPAHQPAFSTDTLDMGVVFTAEQTATHRFVVYNRHSKGMNLADISISGDNAGVFRLNVDGLSGTRFSNVEIRANDSIFVFVSADLPENGTTTPERIDASLDFTVNGVVSSVLLAASGQDVRRLDAVTVAGDAVLTPGAPYRVTDSLVVAEGALLTIEAGTTVLFHDNARLVVRGTLSCEGEPGAPVRLTGDRMGNVITDVSFDLMSRQWYGIDIMPESRDNYMMFTEVSNTTYGVTVYGDGVDVDEPRLGLVNCRLRNSGDNVLSAYGASVSAYGCEFAEAASSLVCLAGGNHRFDLCTTANYYLFAAVSGASWMFPDIEEVEEWASFLPTRALVTNSISYGLGADVVPGDLTGREIFFYRCLFRSSGEDDENFVDTLWNVDPLFYTVRNEYLFDYRLKPESPAIGAAYPYLSDLDLEVDFYGMPRANDLGAYVYVEPDGQ